LQGFDKKAIDNALEYCSLCNTSFTICCGVFVELLIYKEVKKELTLSSSEGNLCLENKIN